MKTDIFNLQIIPLHSILPHEQFDESRAYPLVENLKKEGKLVNPILVTDIGDGQYLQLDGMNRLSAFKMMKYPSILAQIIDYQDQETVELSTWVHLISSTPETLIEKIRKIDGLSVKMGKLEHVRNRYVQEDGLGRVCTIATSRGEVYLISTTGSLQHKVSLLSQLVASYDAKIIRDVLPQRSGPDDVRILFTEHTDAQTLVVFPTFTRHQIVHVVRRKELFPPGVTRFIIKRRCLNVGVRLSVFDPSKSFEEQNGELENLLSKRSFRVFEEPTVYFE